MTTSRSLERRGALPLAYMVALILIAVVMWAASALAEPPSSRSFYDRNGSFAGSSVTRGNSTSFTDRNGRFDGTAIKNSNGTTSSYDKSGHSPARSPTRLPGDEAASACGRSSKPPRDCGWNGR
jgi:hypothetical protein